MFTLIVPSESDLEEELNPSEAGDSGVDDDQRSHTSLSSSTEQLWPIVKKGVQDGSMQDSLSEMSSDSQSQSLQDSAYGGTSEKTSTPIPSVDDSEVDDASKSANASDDEGEAALEGLSLPRTYTDATDASFVDIDAETLDIPRTYSNESKQTAVSDIPEDGGAPEEIEHMLRLMSITSYDAEVAIERHFNIDAVACNTMPILHCVRLMCSFLLAGEPGTLLPDSKTRVSVKSLALSCISHALQIYPEAFLARVMPEDDKQEVKENSVAESKQYVRDCLLLATHADPQIRGMVAGLAGSFIQAALSTSW